MAVDSNGLFARARKAVDETTIATYKENMETGKYLALLDKQQKGGGGLTVEELLDYMVESGYVKEENVTRPTEGDSSGYLEKDGLVFEVKKDENGDITEEYIGEAGNIMPGVEITLSTENATSEVTVKVTGRENLNGLASIEQKGGVKHEYSDTVKEKTEEFVVTENGDYTFIVTSKTGKKVERTIKITNIDKEKPTATYTLSPKDPDDNPEEGGWGQTVTITLTGKDANGIKQITKPDNSVVKGDTAEYIADENKDYKFIIEDNLGNVADYTVTVKNVDKEGPTGSHILNPVAGTYASEVEITVTAEDTQSGVKKITDQDNKVTEGKTAKYKATKNGEYKFTLEDNAGNTKEYQVTVNNVKIPVESIALNPTSLSIYKNATSIITATISPTNATNKTATWSTENGQIATVNDNGNGTATVTGVKAGTTNIVATADGITKKCSVEVKLQMNNVTITKDNYRDYLGKVVTNFRPAGTEETERVGGAYNYTVGTQYRLYYVDFNNKYGDGAGTIYLKADPAGPNYGWETTYADEIDLNKTKVKQLNPELYKTTSPSESNENMKIVKLILNPSYWELLKTSSPIKDSVNYVVGAPSLEMMMDSYNTYYNLTGTSPTTDYIYPGTRRKLFYTYTAGDLGYKVAPYYSMVYDYYTQPNSVYLDSKVDGMYASSTVEKYWLASPAGNQSGSVYHWSSNDGGYLYAMWDDGAPFSPLVSLKATVKLDFTEK